MSAERRTTVVVPTVGRPSLWRLLDSLAGDDGATPPVVVVDDRRTGAPLDLAAYPFARVVVAGGRGPAGARNLGWREVRTPWVSFLDDDVVVEPGWTKALGEDLAEAGPDVVAVQGRVTVPLPPDRPPRDLERSTAGLQTARWITADMTVRRDALAAVGGFEERFRRAYREDADLGLRLSAHGRIVGGQRGVLHPVRPEGPWFSVRQQRGNADDVLMGVLHGPDWRERARAPRGALRWHVATTIAGLVAVLALVPGRRRLAAVGVAAWAGLTGRFAWRRIAPGPRDRREVVRMVLTSVAIPPAAAWWSLAGRRRHRRPPPRLPALVLLDRDGTLVHDVPYNRDPDLVRPVPEAAASLDRLRRAGVRLGVVTNQSGVGRGLIGDDELAAVHRRLDELLGPFDTWQVCRHAPDAGCECRKPAPGMVRQACAELGVRPQDCVLVGDIGADVEAARAAGAVGVLVPTADTLVEEVLDAPTVRRSLVEAVDAILGGDW